MDRRERKVANATTHATFRILFILIFKLAATSFSVGAGFSGGIFAPSLVLGALLGGIFGVAVNNLFPEWVAAYPAYGLVGMGAIVSGATMAPITAIIHVLSLQRVIQKSYW